MGIDDRTFVVLARQAGYPTEEQLRRWHGEQQQRRVAGVTRTMFEVACESGGVPPELARRFERWAQQLGQQVQNPLLETVTDEDEAPRVVHANAADLAAAPVERCPRCQAALDELAVIEGRARAIEGRLECVPCGAVVSLRAPAAVPLPAPPPPLPSLAAPPPPVPVPVAPAAPPVVEAPAASAAATPQRRPSVRPKTASISSRRLAASLEHTGSPGVPLWLPAVGVLAVAGLIAAALAASSRRDAPPRIDEKPASPPPAPSPRPTAPVAPAPPPPEPTPPLVTDTPPPPPRPVEGPKARSADEEARHAIAQAERMESEGRESEALAHLDAAGLRLVGEKAVAEIDEAREGILRRFRARISRDVNEAEALFLAGEGADARAVIADLRAHTPPALKSDWEAAVRALGERLKKAAAEKPQDASPEQGEATALRGTAAAVRRETDAALANFDLAAARAVLAKARDLETDVLELERARVQAVETLSALARAGLSADKGKSVELALRKGRPLAGKLARVEANAIVLVIGAGFERDVGLAELAIEPLARTARRAAKGEVEAIRAAFGAGVLHAALGDRPAARRALEAAVADPMAERFRSQLGEDERPVAQRPRPAQPSRGSQAPAPAPAPSPSTEALDLEPAPPPRPKTWMDDTSGSVSFDQAYTIETDHYVLKTNVKREHAQRWARLLEALAERYTRVFGFVGNDFKYKKNELVLYGDQQTFMYREQVPEHIGGFYEPWSRRIATFHGPWGDRDTTTLGILAHEATHQFEHLVLKNLDNAPTFMIEGLATFFEATEVRPDGEVIVGRIPLDRLRSLQRMIRAGEAYRLRDVIRTPHASFTGTHYSHAWGILHWMLFGPEKDRAQKVLDWYWQLCVDRPATPEDFEAGLAKMGYSMDKLEKAWKDWLLGLSEKNDPAVLAWEKHRKKR